MPPLPRKNRPWKKWILYALLIFPLLIPVLLVVAMAFSLLHPDLDARAGASYSSDLKTLEIDFRRYFHGRSDYPARPLDEMQTAGIVSKFSGETLGRYPHVFLPFSPQTPDDTVVLTVQGSLGPPDRFTKRDLTADVTAPDHLP